MAKSSDEIKKLQRSVNRLRRSEGTVLHVGGQAYLVRSEAVVDPDALLALLTRETVSEAEAVDGLARGFRLKSPARWVDGRWLGALQRDLKILEMQPDLAALTRSSSRLFRGRVIDRDWLAARREQLGRLQEAFAGGRGAMPSLWEAALAVARLVHGGGAAEELERIRERSTRVSAERRRAALERIDRLALRLEGGEPAGEEPELAAFLDGAAQQLRRVEQLPGRARRKRLRQVVASVLAWPGEPDPGTAGEPDVDPEAPLMQQVRSLASWRIAQQGSTRAPEFQERLTLCLSRYGLSFPPGPPGPESGGLRFDEALLDQALSAWTAARKQLKYVDLRMEQVMELLALPAPAGDETWTESWRLGRLGRWVEAGLEMELLRELARRKLLRDLVDQDWDVMTAGSYGRWVTRLAPHYQRLGVELALTPQALARLRPTKHEDLAILAHCLLEHHNPATGGPSARQIALLDATLALFQKLPDRARRCLEGLESTPAGLGATLCPDFAAWLEHDPGLDRYLHLCGLLGLPQAPSKNLLRDWELAARRAAELAYLAALADPSEAQQRRIAQLSRDAPPPGPGWTKRRLDERNEALAVQLLERRIDQALAEILRHAYGLSLDRITPAWRDVFRFYLSTHSNQDLLGLLLRNATAHPGRYFPPSLPANRGWLEKAAGRMNVEAWLRPRRRSLDLDGRRLTLELEADPVEVLRMGVPFDTCLSLQDGSNAAATVLNALDANKRVLYLRDAAGAVVARQLIAVSSDFRFLRYRLYAAQSLSGMEQAFLDLCEEIAREAGLPLGDRGAPEKLHDGFWYDDGVKPFTETLPVPVEHYCRHFLGLPEPPEPDRWLGEDAELWEALCAKDVRRFAANERLRVSTVSHVALAARLVGEMGIGKLTRLYRSGVRELLPVLLWHWEEQGAEALVRAARRLGLSSLEARSICEILQALPLSPAAALEMAGVCADLLASSFLSHEHGFEHGSMSLLSECLGAMNLAQLLDVCDRLAPVWERVVREEPYCARCRADAERAVLAAAEGIFLHDPDARLVVACLRSRRRCDLSRRIALRILGRFPFPRQISQSVPVSAIHAPEPALADAPWVRKALRELAARHPALGRSPEMLAACLRQGVSVDLSAWPVPDEPPFQVLGDLVLQVPDLVPWLAGHFGAPGCICHWSPDPWELYVHRRVETPWRLRLAREIEEGGSQAVRAAQWLHLLERREGKPRRPAGKAREPAPPPADHVDAERLRHALDALWRERGELAGAEAASHRELARELEVLLAPNLPLNLWIWWLAELRALTQGVLGPLLLDVIARGLHARSNPLARLLPPDLVLWLWSFPSLREPLLGVLGEVGTSFEIGRLYRALCEAARACSIDPQELLERWVLTMLRREHAWEVPHAGDRDFLLLVIRTALAHAGPEEWLRLYYDLQDHLAAALFLRELERVPVRKRRKLRSLLQPVKEDWQKPYHFWIEQALASSSGSRLDRRGADQKTSPDRRRRSARQRPDSRRISSRSR